MEYGDFLVDSAKGETVNKLDKIQERALKMIAYQYRDPLRPIIRTLMQMYHIEDLSKRWCKHLLSLMYNISNDIDIIDDYRADRILQSHDQVKLQTLFTRSSKIKKSPYYRRVKEWVKIPSQIQKAETKEQERIQKYHVKGFFLMDYLLISCSSSSYIQPNC